MRFFPLGLAVCFALSAAATRGLSSEQQTTIYVQDSIGVPHTVLHRAQLTVMEAFAGIQIRLAWRYGQLPVDAEEAVGVVFEPAPERFRPAILAYSYPYGTAGTLVHIGYDRVSSLGQTVPLTAALLGYVLAHEIGHVLEMEDVHSQSGVMKNYLTFRDLEQAFRHHLRFDAVDKDRIYTGFKVRASRRSARAGHDLTPSSIPDSVGSQFR